MRTPNKVKKQMLDLEFELDIGWLMFENRLYQKPPLVGSELLGKICGAKCMILALPDLFQRICKLVVRQQNKPAVITKYPLGI